MNSPLALGIFLLGFGVGALLVWLQQAPVRRLLEELETEATRISSKHRSYAFGASSYFPPPEKRSDQPKGVSLREYPLKTL